MSLSNNLPAPRLSVRPFLAGGDVADLTLPRPFLYADGDGTNAVLNVGVKVGTAYSDPFILFGFDLYVPPALFRLVDPLIALAERVGIEGHGR